MTVSDYPSSLRVALKFWACFHGSIGGAVGGALIAAKLTGRTDMAWLWVASPFWVSAGLQIATIVAVAAVLRGKWTLA